MKLSTFAQENSITYKTAYNMFKAGLINGKQLPTGTIVIKNSVNTQKQEFNVIYARVSSSENKDNLESQAKRLSDFCSAKGWIINKVIKEIGSGLNDNRKELTNLLLEAKPTKIIVEHADRLTRFGFNYLQILCKHINCEIIIINEVSDAKQDLIEDFVSIITSFCARIYGQRRCKRKTEKIINDLQNDKTV